MRDDAKPYTMDDVQAWVEMRWERERLDDRTMARIRATVEERDALRAQVERLTSAVPGLAESGPYTLADVERIEAHRGKPYARLRATVEQVERVRKAVASYGAVPVPAHVVLDALEGK